MVLILISLLLVVVGRRRIVQCGVHLTDTENEWKQDVEGQIVGQSSPTQPSLDSIGLEAAATSTAQVAATATPPQPNSSAPRADFVDEEPPSQKDAL